MLDYGFANYGICNSLVSEDELKPIELKKGTKESVSIGLADGFSLLLEKSKIANVEKQITLPSHINAPVHKGHKIGEVEFFSDGQSIGKCDIVAKEDIKAENPWGMFKKLSGHFFYGE